MSGSDYRTQNEKMIREKILNVMEAGADPGFVEPASYTILGALFRKEKS